MGTLRLFPRSCLTCAPEILRRFGARRHSVRTVSRRNQEQCSNVCCSEKRQRRERLETSDNPGGRCMAGGPCPPWRTVARARATDLPRVFGLALASARVFRGGGFLASLRQGRNGALNTHSPAAHSSIRWLLNTVPPVPPLSFYLPPSTFVLFFFFLSHLFLCSVISVLGFPVLLPCISVT